MAEITIIISKDGSSVEMDFEDGFVDNECLRVRDTLVEKLGKVSETKMKDIQSQSSAQLIKQRG